MNENINNNVNKMLKNGWKDEVVSLYQKDNDVGKLNAFKAIGYLDILQSLITKTDINVDLIKQKTRQYAKRQLTWIKHHYINTLKYDGNNYDSVIKQIKQKI
jgi:tRNA dimethylallyltransferase